MADARNPPKAQRHHCAQKRLTPYALTITPPRKGRNRMATQDFGQHLGAAAREAVLKAAHDAQPAVDALLHETRNYKLVHRNLRKRIGHAWTGCSKARS